MAWLICELILAPPVTQEGPAVQSGQSEDKYVEQRWESRQFYSCSFNTSSVWKTTWLLPCGLPELEVLFHAVLELKAVSALQP